MENTNVAAIADGSDVLLDIDKAAEFVHLKKSWLYQLTSLRKIPHLKRGRKLFFSKSELSQWLLEGRVKTISELERQAETRS